ncbi:GAF domain-containing protein [Cellulomonas sp. Marseille-Q8402]
MQPLPQTRQVLAFLAVSGGSEVEDRLRSVADRISALVPSCVGVSLTIPQEDLTLTFVSTSPRALALDMAQSAHGGPCVRSVRTGEELSARDLLDEDRWQRYATTAAAEGVRASLSLPLLDDAGRVTASLNVYAGDPGAFDDVVEPLRGLAGEMTGPVTTNADLSFTSRDRAERSAEELERRRSVDVAIGCLMAMHQIGPADARALLESEAELSDVDLATAADVVLERLDQRRRS